jgi:hypothetical protein
MTVRQSLHTPDADRSCLPEDDPSIMDLWIGPGGHVHDTHPGGMTFGHEAAHRGYHRCLEAWITKGGLVTARDDRQWTIGHFSAQGGHAACFQTWIDHGGPLHALDDSNRTPVWYAVHHFHERCVQMWIESGGNIHVPTARHDDNMRCVLSRIRADRHPRIAISKASVQMMRQGWIRRSHRWAFADPAGHDLAMQMATAFTDPVRMGLWMQAIADHRQA